MASVYLDILHVPPQDARWWQRSLSQDDANALLQTYRRQKDRKRKRGESGHHAPAEESRDQIDEVRAENDSEDHVERELQDMERVPPRTVDAQGLDLKVLRTLLDQALLDHPRDGRTIVEKHRKTVYDRLETQDIRDALVALARKFPDVAKALFVEKNKDTKTVLDFSPELRKAERILHSLDKLSSRQQYDRSGEVNDGISKVVTEIMDRVSPGSHRDTIKHGMEALVDITYAIINLEPSELASSMRNSTDHLFEGPLMSIVDMLSDEDLEASWGMWDQLNKDLGEYGIRFVQEIIDQYYESGED